MIKNFQNIISQKGGALVGAILLLVVLGIMIPALITRNQKETKDSVSQSKKTTSFQLAEAGQDRGAWKLRESASIWEDLLTGTTIQGYYDDKDYEVSGEGIYKIKISAINTTQAEIISKGRATGTTLIRSIRAVYSKGDVEIPAIHVNGSLTYKPNMEVHWGPVITYQSIDLNPTQYFPKKYSAGQIVGRDTNPSSPNGAMPSDDWVTYDYASYYDLGSPPTIDLDAYREKARLTCLYTTLKRKTGNSPATNDTTFCDNSGLYSEDLAIQESGPGGSSLDLACSTCVIFVDGDVSSFALDAFLDIEALVVTGDCDFNARSTNYTANIPNNASDHYQHSSLGTYFTDQGWSDGGTAPLTSVGMHGFLYCGGDVSNAGAGSTIVGAIFIGNQASVNTLKVYYDADVAAGIETGGSGELDRLSWDEQVTGTW